VIKSVDMKEEVKLMAEKVRETPLNPTLALLWCHPATLGAVDAALREGGGGQLPLPATLLRKPTHRGFARRDQLVGCRCRGARRVTHHCSQVATDALGMFAIEQDIAGHIKVRAQTLM
jgi:hypothetical protein